ncbi:MAG: TonB-dependent receptor [Bacteroidota bacterium]
MKRYRLSIFFFLLCLTLVLSTSLRAQDTLYFELRDAQDVSPVIDFSLNLFIYGAGPEVESSLDNIGNGRMRFIDRRNDRVEKLKITAGGYIPLELSLEELRVADSVLYLTPTSFELDGIELTSDRYGEQMKRSPHVVKPIKAREIRFRNPQTSADVLQGSGEVFVQKSQMGGGSPVIRGFEANKVLIVVDGVRLNNAIYRGGHLQNVITIDPNMLNRVEVLMGPGSLMYGSDALGGVMHFVTRNPTLQVEQDKPLVTGNYFMRTATANFETTAHLDLNLGFRRFGMLTSATFSNFGDLRTGANHPEDYPDFGKRFFFADRVAGRDTVVPNGEVHLQKFSGYKQWDLMQKFYYYHKDIPLSHSLNIQFSNTGDVPRYDRLSEIRGGSLRYADWHYGPQRRLMGIFNTSLGELEGVSFYNFARLTLSYQAIEESRINRRFGDAQERSRIENVQVVTANLDFEKIFRDRYKLDYGAEFTTNDVQSDAFQTNINSGAVSPLDTRYPDGGSAMRTASVYLYSKLPLNSRQNLILSGGARLNQVYLRSRFISKEFFPFLADEVEQNYLVPTGSMGLVWLPGKDWKFSVLGSTGFRAPNVDDVGKVFDSEPGSVIVPNPEVSAEYTYNGEINVSKVFAERLQVGVAAWYTWYDDALVVRNATLNGRDSILFDGELSRVKTMVNARQANIRGIHFNLNLRILPGLELTHTLTYTRGNDVSLDSIQPLDHIPPLYGRTGLQYNRKRLRLEAYTLYNGWKRIEDYQIDGEDNEQYATPEGMPAWWTLNFKSSFVVNENFRIQLGLENILDRHYRFFASGISAPGRNLIIALRSHF